MKWPILILIVISFLFNGCSQKKPEPIIKKIYIKQELPLLKNLKEVDINTSKFYLDKKDYNETSYIVPKEQLLKASLITQKLRYKNYMQQKQINFYIYQNNKFNLLIKEDTNDTK